ncbi:MAG: hypothetical protein JWO38_189 [Gemmataceae bacterium]|nr:hypothetical protein [Gemmataceae bacterium]
MRVPLFDILNSTGAAISSRRPDRPFRDLHVAGTGGVALYLLAAGYFTFSGGTTAAVSELVRWALALGLLAAFAVGYRALRSVPESRRVRRVVAGYAVVLTASAAAVPAFHSTDLYVYVNIGWQQAEYGVNPYRTRLFETPNWLTDPMFRQEWQFVPCSYGFLFALETRVACEIGGRDHAAVVAILKTVAAGTVLALGAVAWAVGRALRRPDPLRGAYLVLWNPLLLLHGVSNAHNDLQFALGVGLAVLGFARGRWLVVFPALAAAGLVKYLSVILVPFFFLASVRRVGWGRTATSCAAAAGLCVACWWPYRDGFDTSYLHRMGGNLTVVHNSLASIVVFPYEVAVKLLPAGDRSAAVFFGAVKGAFWGAFAVFIAVVLVDRVRRGRGEAGGLARDAVLILLGAILASPKYHAWYLGMVLPLAVWLPAGSRLRRAVLGLGVANLLSITFVYQSHLLNAVLMLVVPLWLAIRTGPTGPEPAVRGGRLARPAVRQRSPLLAETL